MPSRLSPIVVCLMLSAASVGSAQTAAQHKGDAALALGHKLVKEGKRSEATRHYADALAAYQSDKIEAKIEQAAEAKGWNDLQLKDYSAAQKAYELAWSIAEKLYNPGEGSRVRYLGTLGEIALARKDHRAAITYLRQSIKEVESKNGPGHPTTTDKFAHLILAYEAIGRSDAAGKLREHLVDMCRDFAQARDMNRQLLRTVDQFTKPCREAGVSIRAD